MGRKTFESIGRPLPGRLNVVVSRNDAYQPAGVLRAHSICEAFAQVIDHEEVMIAGGASFYSQMMPFATTLYLTLIDAEIEGDTFFPDYLEQEWAEVSRTHRPADSDNRYPLTFLTLQRCLEPDSYPVCEIEPD